MAELTPRGVPYPSSTDRANVPRDLKALADVIDDLLGRIENLEAGGGGLPLLPQLTTAGTYTVAALTQTLDGTYSTGALVANADGLYLIGA